MSTDEQPPPSPGGDPAPDPPRRAPSASREATTEELTAWRRFHFVVSGEGDREPSPAGLRPAWIPAPSWEADPEGNWAPAQEGDEDREAFPCDELLPLRLLLRLAHDNAEQTLRRWHQETRPLLKGLRLLLERSGTGESLAAPGADGSALGEMGARFLDPGALMSRVTVSRVRSRQRSDLEPGRRRRIEEAAEALAAASERAAATAVVICDPALGDPRSAIAGEYAEWKVQWLIADDPFAAAADSFDRIAAELAPALAAVRVARLELDQSYRPEIHDAALETFDWQAFHVEELPLLPLHVVWVGAERAAATALGSLSRLLLSGRPIQVLIATDPATSPGADEGAPELRFEPAYFGLSHRGAFVQQGSAASPQALLEGFRCACRRTGAGLHVVATPSAGGTGALSYRELAAAANAARAHPHFLFDPDAGGDWAKRFLLEANPDLEADWPQSGTAVAGEVGGDALSFTYADYLLLAGLRREDFRPIDDELRSEALVPLADWLTLSSEEALHSLPFLWAATAEGTLRRVAVTRQLALACRDRLDFWRTLQQLGGVHDPYVERAKAADREATASLVAAERERLAGEHAAALAEQRKQVAVEVVQRLMQGLLHS